MVCKKCGYRVKLKGDEVWYRVCVCDEAVVE